MKERVRHCARVCVNDRFRIVRTDHLAKRRIWQDAVGTVTDVPVSASQDVADEREAGIDRRRKIGDGPIALFHLQRCSDQAIETAIKSGCRGDPRLQSMEFGAEFRSKLWHVISHFV
jgi:hypothetical protein